VPVSLGHKIVFEMSKTKVPKALVDPMEATFERLFSLNSTKMTRFAVVLWTITGSIPHLILCRHGTTFLYLWYRPRELNKPLDIGDEDGIILTEQRLETIMMAYINRYAPHTAHLPPNLRLAYVMYHQLSRWSGQASNAHEPFASVFAYYSLKPTPLAKVYHDAAVGDIRRSLIAMMQAGLSVPTDGKVAADPDFMREYLLGWFSPC